MKLFFCLFALVVKAKASSFPPPLDDCKDIAVLARSSANCRDSSGCTITGGSLGIDSVNTDNNESKSKSSGNFEADNLTETQKCAVQALAAYQAGVALTADKTILPEMGGETFTPGIHTSSCSDLNIGVDNPLVILDGDGDSNGQFIFQADYLSLDCGTSFTFINGARAENVFWILGTDLDIEGDSVLAGNVFAGSGDVTLIDAGNINGPLVFADTYTVAGQKSKACKTSRKLKRSKCN
mmetsp:Transcript_18987/g.24447  ORF Transcript_18987/g.24447 Transcript_18987/m.24447 type:complete len:239 (-) Transcript_18987:47-763(-)|eukprot:CAMPEP_0198142280 /NCGR_PEP_ID=MMETSP1443-20131203/5107_1 /TAXON_ID=186043 /ORGANISM="Entomoneis sp., Strain CCMP2396" /LENGTH=238 /DNA_ID=CAMNT_0043805251 /DNA_START=70 /DNA_END=786 /DNA_ORIENTATION=-